jgi:hypothetical protein
MIRFPDEVWRGIKADALYLSSRRAHRARMASTLRAIPLARAAMLRHHGVDRSCRWATDDDWPFVMFEWERDLEVDMRADGDHDATL